MKTLRQKPSAAEHINASSGIEELKKFSKSKGRNSVKNQWTVTELEINL